MGSTPAVLKGEEKGDQELLLARHMPSPLQPAGPISSPTSEFSCYGPGQSLYYPHLDTRCWGLFLVSSTPMPWLCVGEAKPPCSSFLTEDALTGLTPVEETQLGFNESLSCKTKNAVSETARPQPCCICLYTQVGEGEHRDFCKSTKGVSIRSFLRFKNWLNCTWGTKRHIKVAGTL